MDGILYPGMSLVDRLGIGGGSGQPAVPAEDNGPDLSMLLEQLKQNEADKKKQEALEKVLQDRMGVTIQDRQKNLIADDTPKGFWGKLGKFGLEALAGAAQGRNYQPYSDRMMDRAMKQHQLETPGLREQLDSVVSQKNNLTTNQQRLEKDRQTAIANAAKRLQADKLMGLKKTQFEALQPLRDATVDKTKAQTGVLGSQAQKLDAETEGVQTKTQNQQMTMGLTGMPGAAMGLTNKANADKVEPFLDLLNRVDANKQKNKSLFGPKPQAKPTKWRIATGMVDEVTGMPMLINDAGDVRSFSDSVGAVPKQTGENAGAISRSVAAYKQMDDALEPLIDRLAAKGKFGALPGSWEKFKGDQGLNKDPDYAELNTLISSISKFGAGIHRQNSVESAKDIYNQIMLVKSSPEAMKAGLNSVRKAFVDRGMMPGSDPYWSLMGYDINEIANKFNIKRGRARLNPATPGISPSSGGKRPTPMERSMSGVSGGSDLEKAKAALLKKIQGVK